MCGICGVVYPDPGRSVDREMLRQMTDIVSHRGPDGHGFHVAPGIGLGIRRLSIIDLQTGDQPISNEDGTVTVVCNGEIYNFRELRQELVAAGHRFRTGSDVEVIVHLYEDYGVQCVNHLRGMFSFALWDERRRKLVLARDRFGIKPLFYAFKPDGFFFGSELKSILISGRIERQIDVHALKDLFTIGFVLAPKTLCSRIRRLLPGHYLVYQNGAMSIHRYWDLRFPVRGERTPRMSVGAWAEALRAKLEDSVRIHLRSDVPVGAWLSGGIDSSGVVSLMSQLTDHPVQTFTLAFENSRFDEVSRSRILSDFTAYNLLNQRVVCATKDFELLPKSIWHSEDPFGFGLELTKMVISRLASKHVKAVLIGEGADEILGGYQRFNRYKVVPPLRKLRRFIGNMPAIMKRRPIPNRRLEAPAELNLESYKQIIRLTYKRTIHSKSRYDDQLLSDDIRQNLVKDENPSDLLNLPQEFGRWHPFAQMQYLETMVRLPNYLNRQLDSASMAYSLEARVPFLDHELVEFCAQIPPNLKMRGREDKHILRMALRNDLPLEILQRRKRGLAAPYSQWIYDLPEFAKELLSKDQLRTKGYFNPEFAFDMLEQHRAGKADHGDSLMSILGVQIWDDLFLRSRQSVA